MSQPVGKDCGQCGHDFDPHAVIALFEDPLQGGIILCPEKGCQCFSTWAAGNLPRPTPPPDEDVQIIRERLQEGTL